MCQLFSIFSSCFGYYDEPIQHLSLWESKKNDYIQWRIDLFNDSLKTLKNIADNNFELAALNEMGVYHKVNPSYADLVQRQLIDSSVRSSESITQGSFPGIWCALYDPTNTFSAISSGSKIFSIKFNADYKLFDPSNSEHQKLWENWHPQEKENRWQNPAFLQSLAVYTKGPNHSAFFEEHGFGAFIGYSDYMALVILDEKAIETVEIVRIF